MKKQISGVILGVTCLTVSLYTNQALADSRIAGCYSKVRGIVSIIKNGLAPTESLTSKGLLGACNKLNGNLVIWSKVGPRGPRGLRGFRGPRGISTTGPNCIKPLRGDNLVGCDLTLTNVDLTSAKNDLRSIRAAGAILDGKNWSGYDFTGADFTTASMKNASFVSGTGLPATVGSVATTFNYAVFSGADLSGADFTGASLQFANFIGDTFFVGTNFSGANLCGAKFLASSFFNRNFKIPSNFLTIILSQSTICPNNTPATAIQGTTQFVCNTQQLIPADFCAVGQ